jgi:hypothetical protein
MAGTCPAGLGLRPAPRRSLCFTWNAWRGTRPTGAVRRTIRMRSPLLHVERLARHATYRAPQAELPIADVSGGALRSLRLVEPRSRGVSQGSTVAMKPRAALSLEEFHAKHAGCRTTTRPRYSPVENEQIEALCVRSLTTSLHGSGPIVSLRPAPRRSPCFTWNAWRGTRSSPGAIGDRSACPCFTWNVWRCCLHVLRGASRTIICVRSPLFTWNAWGAAA